MGKRAPCRKDGFRQGESYAGYPACANQDSPAWKQRRYRSYSFYSYLRFLAS